jgi:hypothetical protein
MLFRTTFANEQLNHLRDKQSLRWKISEDTICRLLSAPGLTTIPNRSASTFSRRGKFCSSVGFNTARFIKIGSLKTNTRNVFFILRLKFFFGLFISLIKGIETLQTLLTIYFRFCFVYIFNQPSGKTITLYF